jgi:hypothetical protein
MEHNPTSQQISQESRDVEQEKSKVDDTGGRGWRHLMVGT